MRVENDLDADERGRLIKNREPRTEEPRTEDQGNMQYAISRAMLTLQLGHEPLVRLAARVEDILCRHHGHRAAAKLA